MQAWFMQACFMQSKAVSRCLSLESIFSSVASPDLEPQQVLLGCIRTHMMDPVEDNVVSLPAVNTEHGICIFPGKVDIVGAEYSLELSINVGVGGVLSEVGRAVQNGMTSYTPKPIYSTRIEIKWEQKKDKRQKTKD